MSTICNDIREREIAPSAHDMLHRAKNGKKINSLVIPKLEVAIAHNRRRNGKKNCAQLQWKYYNHKHA